MIVVTGASRGLGAAICQRLRQSGHEVVGLARQVGGLENGVACDVGDPVAVKNTAKEIKARGGEVEALINAAGVAAMNLAVTTDSGTVEKLIRTNLLGTIFCCQSFAPLMLRNKKGLIVNFSTIAVHLALKGESVYAASKAGVETFSRAFAREMADFNVRVNCLAPGPIKTDLLRGITDQQIDQIVREQIIPKVFDKSDICDLVEWLLDEKSGSLTGQVFHVGGV